MVPSLSSTVKFDELREVAAADIPSTYASADAKVGDPVAFHARLMIFQNLTNVQLRISDDGQTDRLTLPSGGQVVFDWMSNQSSQTGYYAYPPSTQWYVKYDTSAATTGDFFITVAYGRGE